MKCSILGIASVVALGCVATRYSPPLDRELTDTGTRFLKSTSIVVNRDDVEGNVVEASLARTVENSRARITVLRNHSDVWPGRGFQCFEPLLYVLTLGVIPADCTNDYTFEATLEYGESSVALRREYTVTQIQGWSRVYWYFSQAGSSDRVQHPPFARSTPP